ncbi:hypothetical protein A4H97_09450 [Niastella yeongjuensis]|uniref:Secretin/TonB short N-terminal domain-containing protein n=1 Tax=Niastella yeongjuensis TaxID=354355 RepID=A0A1V9EEP0_9BACT|nr:SusC/RagA family TonB-linked outer membrane protein [Niastella yeongjuensis]OQP44583.1 hypothetical protein A4H97_09450 [Niastella yeongjuensis]SEO82458.1 TonB-linked outer membrane protein, SusC/RagA family [Niastella yeongjuensis]
MKLRTWCIRSGQLLTKPVLVFAGFLVFLTIFNPATMQAEDDWGGITIRHENAPIQKVFQSIEKQSGYRFFYNETLLQGAVKVSLNLQNVSLQEALDACFRNQPLSYAIVDKTIIVKRRPEQQPVAPVPTAVSFTLPNKGKLIAVRGKVTSNNIPVAGASIMIKGTDNGASTDKDGIFTLSEVDEDAVLVVSSVSHQAREVRLNGQGFITIDLAQQSDNLDEAVVVAYNTTTVKRNTAAVTVVKGEQIQNLPNRSFDKSLQGLVPGLLVTGGTGQPGAPPSNFVLRGIATGAQPTNGESFRNPLIIIDGIPVTQDPPANTSASVLRITNPLAQLNPSDIESISVLKDASAVALYGSKASNGVLLVTTKKGKTGKTVFNFRHQTDVSSAIEGKIKMLSQEEYLALLFEAYRNNNPTLYSKDAAILTDLRKKFPIIVNSPGDTSFYEPSNWVDEYFKKAAVTVSNEISMSGGNERSNFYINLEYTKQDGVTPKTGYDRKSVRFNYEHRPTSWLKLGINTGLSYNIQQYASEGTNNFLKVIAISPLNPIRDMSGNLFYKFNWGLGGTGGSASPTPIAQTDLNINNSTAFRGINKLYGEARFKNFAFSSTLGVDFMLNEVKQKAHPLVSIGTTMGSLTEQPFRSANVISTNILRFNKSWNRIHDLNILVGQEAQIASSKYLTITRTNLSSNPNSDQLLTGTVSAAGGNTSKQTLLSYFSQLNYGLFERYYISGSLRSDGASNFGKNNRFGSYWSIGGGWIISDEPLLRRTNKWLNLLKVRGSMGPAGNSAAVTDMLRFDALQLRNYLNGVAVYPAAGNPGNPSIKWEQTFVWDAGLELRILKDRINITADIYTRKTKNLIAYDINAPLATGTQFFTGNVGDIKNKGIELSMASKIIAKGDFRWNINLNWSKNQNRLTKSFYPRTTITGTNLVNEVGSEYNSFYLRRWAGVNPDNGRPMWVDSTGKFSENYMAAKPEIVGKAQPDGFGAVTNSFGYKGIELSAAIYYQYGSKIYYNSNLQNDGSANNNDPYLNQTKSALDRWQKPGDIAANPRRLLNGQAITSTGTVLDEGTNASTRYLYDGDFIRLANVALAYSFQRGLIERLHLSSARIFIQGHNLATWTKYSGQDPENIGSSGFGSIIYPQQRSYTVGLNVSF